MFIQLVRCRVKRDAWPQVEAWLRRWQAEEAPSSVGYKGEYLLREQDDPCSLLKRLACFYVSGGCGGRRRSSSRLPTSACRSASWL
jgi:hypothetical protein